MKDDVFDRINRQMDEAFKRNIREGRQFPPGKMTDQP
jgi:hypothetical protein